VLENLAESQFSLVMHVQYIIEAVHRELSFQKSVHVLNQEMMVPQSTNLVSDHFWRCKFVILTDPRIDEKCLEIRLEIADLLLNYDESRVDTFFS